MIGLIWLMTTIFCQEAKGEDTEYVSILKRCVFAPGRKTLERSLLVNIDGERRAWTCKTCQGYMQKSKMPPTCQNNKLQIKEAEELLRLNKFDNMLIARIILFMFISQLPMSRMEALKGKVTLVPIQEEDIVKTVAAGEAFPRTPTAAGLVTYELRKKQEYRQTVGRPQLVNPKSLVDALKVLRESGNPYFQLDIEDVDKYFQRCVEEDPQGAGVAFPEMAEGDHEVNKSSKYLTRKEFVRYLKN